MNNPTCITRTFTRAAIVVFAAGLLFTSCKKNSSADDDNTISDEEVAETVTQSFSAGSGGMIMETDAAATVAIQNKLTCGQTKDSTIAGASLPGSTIKWAFSYHLSRSLTCSDGIPTTLNLSSEGKTSYTTLRMSSLDSSYGKTVITGLEPGSANLVLNQQYLRKGSQQSLVREKRSFTSTITITGTNITISKATRKIISGTSAFEFEGKTSGGRIITRSGTITFNGEQKATLKLLNGASYAIQW